MDHVPKSKRSEIMRAVKSKGTKPELIVRSAAHQLGLRFRLHKSDLPGKPDLVFKKWKTALFVHGCYWHRHPGCKKATTPKTNIAFWEQKFVRNIERDRQNIEQLQVLGWKVVIIWQCEVPNVETARMLLGDIFTPELLSAVR